VSRILVTGGRGFLGRHLVHQLIDAGERDLRVLVTSGDAELTAQGVEVVVGSVLSPDDVARAVDRVEVVYHLAGRVSRNPDDTRELYGVHVEGTRVLCDASRAAGVERIILASTSGTIAVTEHGDEVPDETWPRPLKIIGRWPYYASKLYQEQTARRACLDGPELVILHPSLLLGPGDHRLSSTNDVLMFLTRQIRAIPPGGLNFVDVRDAASAFVAALHAARPGEAYLLGGPNWTFETFFARLERVSDVAAPRLKLPGKLFKWGGDALDAWYRYWGLTPPVDPVSVDMSRYFWYLDAGKAARELGFAARDPGETLYETVACLKEQFLASPLGR
jgi:dihydroflavonol-4-reductase